MTGPAVEPCTLAVKVIGWLTTTEDELGVTVVVAAIALTLCDKVGELLT